MNKTGPLAWRRLPQPEDAARVEDICRGSGFFNAEEIGVARELVEERLVRGLASGYRFWFAMEGSFLAGYACYGPISGSEGSWDLYWIVVAPSHQGRGMGRRLLARVCTSAAKSGATRIYAETSSRAQYEPTRRFYLKQGFTEQARLDEFYAPDDDKVIYCLALP